MAPTPSTITLLNRTQDILYWESDILQPNAEVTKSFATSFLLPKISIGTGDRAKSSMASFRLLSFLKHGKWRRIKKTSTLTVYSTKTSHKHTRVIVFPTRNLLTFLSDMPDSTPLSAVCLPGTHDTMARFGWPISQCQSATLADQLASGIRALDVRLSADSSSRLMAYHGIIPQFTSFQSILTTVHDFLTNPVSCREALVMSIMQEDYPKTSRETFSSLVWSEIASAPGGNSIWFLNNRVPSLGEMRGKVIMVSRFGGDNDDRETMGMHPTYWPGSPKEPFTWPCKDTVVRTHDWYNIGSFLAIPEKAQLATDVLVQAIDPPLSGPVLTISFTSASSFPLAFPPAVANGFGWPNWGLGVEGVNSRVTQRIAGVLSGPSETQSDLEKLSETEPRIRGWVFMDYYTEELVQLLVESNYYGRITGQEGW